MNMQHPALMILPLINTRSSWKVLTGIGRAGPGKPGKITPISRRAPKGTALIERNSSNLLNLVNKILDLHKLEAQKLKLHPVQSDIIRHLNYIIESLHSLAEGKAIGLRCTSNVEKLMMDFDPEKFTGVMVNLLSNAIKYTENGGWVEVNAQHHRAGAYGAAEERLVLTIIDSGVGISADKLPHIFDRFYQIDDPAARHAGGTGIGLSLVRELLQLMNGTISVQSEVEKGTVFTVVLPITRTEKLLENTKEERVLNRQQSVKKKRSGYRIIRWIGYR
ncbi:MAG: HAMP domain-containing histidine kinase [Phaeodactylibacter sp.]|nr:HAMP domain-containing histidine kinase [Phaeodactylibacter sp.]